MSHWAGYYQLVIGGLLSVSHGGGEDTTSESWGGDGGHVEI